jgi:uncharacterized protein YjaZ
MSINLYILKASGRLKVLENQIESAFDGVLRGIENKITLPHVDVVIDDDVNSVIPETGVGGFAPSANLLYIHINPDFKGIEQKIDFEIKSTLAHELHHCARWASCGYGKTLLEAIISEGLADHFDIEINNGPPKPWSVAVAGSELEKLKEKARSEFTNDNYDHSVWFFGSESKNIPRWTGYSLGFSLVGDYIKKSGKKASELVSERAESFIA